MKITHKISPTILPSITAKDIPVGTVFNARVGHGSFDRFKAYLRTYKGIVDLADPIRTWSTKAVVEQYCVLEAELVIHGERK